MEGYKMEPMLLSTEEAVSLFLGGSVIQQYPRLDSTQAITKAPAWHALGQAPGKIEALLPEEYKSDIRRAKERILFDMSPIWSQGEDTHLETLKNAILSNQKARITYPSHCQLIPDERVINPYGLVCKGGVWNLIAFCHIQAAFVVFLVDRIKAVEILDETFHPMADFDVRGFWERYAKEIARAFQARIEEEKVP